jgi:hypothetical protein
MHSSLCRRLCNSGRSQQQITTTREITAAFPLLFLPPPSFGRSTSSRPCGTHRFCRLTAKKIEERGTQRGRERERGEKTTTKKKMTRKKEHKRKGNKRFLRLSNSIFGGPALLAPSNVQPCSLFCSAGRQSMLAVTQHDIIEFCVRYK